MLHYYLPTEVANLGKKLRLLFVSVSRTECCKGQSQPPLAYLHSFSSSPSLVLNSWNKAHQDAELSPTSPVIDLVKPSVMEVGVPQRGCC